MSKLQLVLGCCLIAGFVSTSSFALGLGDAPKPKKDKKKEEKKEEKKETEKKGDSKKTEPAAEPAEKKDDAKTTQATPAWAKDVEAILDKALQAFNADDHKAFFADFSKDMGAMANAQMYNALYGNQKKVLGNYVTRTFNKDRSNFQNEEGVPGLFRYEADFEKQKGVAIEVNYLKEGGAWKLMQVLFSHPDLQAKMLEAMAPGGVHQVQVVKSAWGEGGMGNAKAGDWVEYEYPAQEMKMKVRQEVLEIGDHFIVMSSKNDVNGAVTEQKMKMIYNQPDPELPKTEEEKLKWEVKKFDDKVTVGGKEFSAVRHETYIDGKLSAKVWISKDLPLGGIARSEGADGVTNMIMTAYGRK
jgi:hypothetical protein